MTNNSTPTRGLTVRSSYNMYKGTGEFEVIDIQNGQRVARRFFRNATTSDNMITLLGICKACQFWIENNYTEKIYCTNEVAYVWARNKRFKTKVSSPGMIKLVKESLAILIMNDFSEVITLWKPDWGNMRDFLDNLDDGLPF